MSVSLRVGHYKPPPPHYYCSDRRKKAGEEEEEKEGRSAFSADVTGAASAQMPPRKVALSCPPCSFELALRCEFCMIKYLEEAKNNLLY